MLPSELRWSLLIALAFYFVIILLFLKNKALELRYTLLWLFAGLVLLILVINPDIISYAIRPLGIQSNMNGLYIIAFGFVIMIVMALTSIVSRQMKKIRILAQQQAIMEERIRMLEKDSETSNQAVDIQK